MMRERERCDRGQPDAFGILFQQAFIRRMAFNMTPTKFPTEQILIALHFGNDCLFADLHGLCKHQKKQSRSCERCTR